MRERNRGKRERDRAGYEGHREERGRRRLLEKRRNRERRGERECDRVTEREAEEQIYRWLRKACAAAVSKRDMALREMRGVRRRRGRSLDFNALCTPSMSAYLKYRFYPHLIILSYSPSLEFRI